jgi:hypothetical protein
VQHSMPVGNSRAFAYRGDILVLELQRLHGQQACVSTEIPEWMSSTGKTTRERGCSRFVVAELTRRSRGVHAEGDAAR